MPPKVSVEVCSTYRWLQRIKLNSRPELVTIKSPRGIVTTNNAIIGIKITITRKTTGPLAYVNSTYIVEVA